MKRLAEGVEQLGGFPPNLVNAYLVDGVLIDSGLRLRSKLTLRQLRGREVKAHALTHGHGDHQGASRAVRDALGVTLACGAGDADAVESGKLGPLLPDNLIGQATRLHSGPACPVARRLVEGDDFHGLRVLDVPGHSPGHVAYWREAGRVLILGDVLTNMNLFTTLPGLHEPPGFFTVDPALSRRSVRKLIDLKPSLVCFGHGPPLRDPERFAQFIARLPD